MSLTLYQHPLSSFVHKVLVALYENGTPFDSVLVDYGNAESRAAFFALWPIGKIPVLRDDRLGHTLPETSIIIEYLQQHYPGQQPLLPSDPAKALKTRLWDRFFDNYIHAQMQKIVGDRIRPANEKDPRGVADARAALHTAYGVLDKHLAGKVWATGEAFSMADCAAAPALFYAGILEPFADHPNIAAYFERLVARPSYARALAGARPYFPFFPYKDDIPARFRADAAP